MRTPFAFLGKLSRRSLVAGLGAIVLTGGLVAGTALAADPTPAPNSRPYFENFVAKLAEKLGKSEAEVSAAIAESQRDLVDEAAKNGKLPKGLADRLKGRLNEGPAPFGPFPGARAVVKARVGHAVGYEIQAAADYLGIPVEDLRVRLRAGDSLAEIADDTADKSVAGLKDALFAAAKPKLDEIAAERGLAAEQRNTIEAQLKARIESLVTQNFGVPQKQAEPKKQVPPGQLKPKVAPGQKG